VLEGRKKGRGGDDRKGERRERPLSCDAWSPVRKKEKELGRSDLKRGKKGKHNGIDNHRAVDGGKRGHLKKKKGGQFAREVRVGRE